MRKGAGQGLVLAIFLGWSVGFLACGTAAKDLPPGTAIDTGKPSLRVIQQDLRRHGYAPGKVDGRLDSRTRSAVREFQADCGLPADSSAGGITKEKLIHPERCRNAR